MPISTTAATNTNWACSAVAIIILLTRAILSRGTIHVTLLSKWICVISILVIAARLPLIYFLMIYTFRDDGRDGRSTFSGEGERVKKAAIITLTTRVLATTYFWLQVALLLRFYSRIIGHIQWARRAITATWIFFFSTYIAVVLITIFECHPVHLYWSAEIPVCQQARAQIFTQGIFNIILDVTLLAIVLPIIARTRLATPQKVQIFGLLFLGTICIVVTGLKLEYVVGSDSSQAMRTFWASIGVAVSTFVANMPTIVGCASLKWPWRKLARKTDSDDRDHTHQSSKIMYYQKNAASADPEMDGDRRILKEVDVDVVMQDTSSTASRSSCARSAPLW